MPRTEAELAREALEIQDASNVLGLTKGFARAAQELRELDPKADTFTLSRHPVLKLWADKLADLCRVRSVRQFHEAYDACTEIAQGKSHAPKLPLRPVAAGSVCRCGEGEYCPAHGRI